MVPCYPILLISGSDVECIASDAEATILASMTTKKAVADGFFDKAVIFDSAGSRYGVVALKRQVRRGLLSRLTPSAHVEGWELEARGVVTLEEAKEMVSRAIGQAPEFWDESLSDGDLHVRVGGAGTFGDLFAIFK